MIIVCVDDLRLFGDTFQDCLIHYATNSSDALKFLEENLPLIQEVWLDHDLGDGDEITPVINWLDEKAREGKTDHISCIRILTNNPVGYNKIMLALQRHFFVGITPKHVGIRDLPQVGEL